MAKKGYEKAKGRSSGQGEQYLRLPYHMINHPNFRALGGSCVKVLLALCAKHNGYNNGRIFMSLDDMQNQLYMGKATAKRACEDLAYYGFIKLKKCGNFYGRKAHEWEITFLKSEGYNPTHEWKHEKKRLRQKKKRPKKIDFIEEAIQDLEK